MDSVQSGVPTGIRTPVTSVKGMCPRPLDDGDAGQTIERPENVEKSGGARRDRTADLLHAMQALSQLSYGPRCIKLQRFATQVHEIKALNSKPSQRIVSRSDTRCYTLLGPPWDHHGASV